MKDLIHFPYPFTHPTDFFKTMQNILVRQPGDLTIDWAQRVVNKHYPHIIVSSVDIVSVDIGTTTRIRVKVEHNEPAKIGRASCRERVYLTV